MFNLYNTKILIRFFKWTFNFLLDLDKNDESATYYLKIFYNNCFKLVEDGNLIDLYDTIISFFDTTLFFG